MANPFLTSELRDIETAILWEKAHVVDIGKAVAYTDGTTVFINTEDNLYRILPNYNMGMLKWLLWHERYHLELRHHNRFFKYLAELSEDDTKKEFQLAKEEVNIIMDILVHDSLSKMFPELVDIAISNLAQMRYRNSLGYTFTTHTLEEMLDEYRKYKESEEGDGDGKGKDSEDGGDSEGKDKEDKSTKKKTPSKRKSKSHGASESEHKPEKPDTKEEKEDKDGEEEDSPKETEEKEETPTPAEHDKTDWSKLDDIDSKEFIDEDEAGHYLREIARIKRIKINMGRLTNTLNSLATTTKIRTYRMPSMLQPKDGCIFKGKLPGKVELYLVFDASGSMGSQLKLFKEIISKSIPQAMNCPCEWFAGYGARIPHYKMIGGNGYYKGKFKDIMPVWANDGFNDDGNRTIELCYQAEQKGYSPIGVTDGGGNYYHKGNYDYDKMADKIKQLKRTVLVGQRSSWLETVRKINPHIQVICLEEE